MAIVPRARLVSFCRRRCLLFVENRAVHVSLSFSLNRLIIVGGLSFCGVLLEVVGTSGYLLGTSSFFYPRTAMRKRLALILSII
jgi:hypothetical protein